ncbi:conserved protein of unknown function (plasmid) [Rhodovastum atsumiense]|uniref:Uncharacterized protein n=1 Tax=Rhodovastum atsumiense TaxID=504468 RepID=A0A5M6ITR2_9PROT|nr:hypothetical protein [Rhodovastum atsumiense]KAA5611652.1 hypothetical protein F1189_13915 [Rhodovastum atsumiense]CAH2606249.1 conserved protein of unknown function [Rhodovastum atsumiense]
MSTPTDPAEQQAEDDEMVLVEISSSPWFSGFCAAATKSGDANPHPVDSEAWREWQRGQEAAANADWQTIVVPDA